MPVAIGKTNISSLKQAIGLQWDVPAQQYDEEVENFRLEPSDEFTCLETSKDFNKTTFIVQQMSDDSQFRVVISELSSELGVDYSADVQPWEGHEKHAIEEAERKAKAQAKAEEQTHRAEERKAEALRLAGSCTEAMEKVFVRKVQDHMGYCVSYRLVGVEDGSAGYTTLLERVVRWCLAQEKYGDPMMSLNWVQVEAATDIGARSLQDVFEDAGFFAHVEQPSELPSRVGEALSDDTTFSVEGFFMTPAVGVGWMFKAAILGGAHSGKVLLEQTDVDDRTPCF